MLWRWNHVACKSSKRLDGRVAVVTGANSGIGLETADDLARRGCTVIMACRSEERANNAKEQILNAGDGDKPTNVTPEQLEVELLDLASFASIRQFASRCLEKHPKIDLLINNAGLSSNQYTETEEGHELTMGCNHLGHFLLTHLLLPALKSAAADHSDSRVVTVSSCLHKPGRIIEPDLKLKPDKYTKYLAYCNSKLANVMFARELAHRLEGTGVTSFSLHPGAVNTSIWTSSRGWKETLLRLLAPYIMKTASQGAQTTLHCALADDLENGAYYVECAPEEPVPLATDDAVCTRLWELSASLVGCDSA